jgi:hypothetical protein
MPGAVVRAVAVAVQADGMLALWDDVAPYLVAVGTEAAAVVAVVAAAACLG